MDPTSQRAVEEEVESHAPPAAAETGGMGVKERKREKHKFIPLNSKIFT